MHWPSGYFQTNSGRQEQTRASTKGSFYKTSQGLCSLAKHHGKKRLQKIKRAPNTLRGTHVNHPLLKAPFIMCSCIWPGMWSGRRWGPSSQYRTPPADLTGTTYSSAAADRHPHHHSASPHHNTLLLHSNDHDKTREE